MRGPDAPDSPGTPPTHADDPEAGSAGRTVRPTGEPEASSESPSAGHAPSPAAAAAAAGSAGSAAGGAGAGALGHFTTRRPVAVFVVFVAAVVFGLLSYGRLPVNLMPELSYPTLTVRTEYPGAAPEEVENDVSRPVEEALGVIGGLKRLSSVSRAGVSDVVLEFTWDTEMSEAAQDVLEKLDLVFLPDEAERPLILHYDPSLDPVMELSLSGTGERFAGEEGLRRLRRLAELQVKRQLEPIAGVAAVRVRGGLEEEIHVLLEEEALDRAGVSIQTVIDRLAQENVNVAGGTIQEGRTEYMVRTLNEYQDVGQIADTVVTRIDGRDVRVRDLGRVERAHKEREIVTRTGGGESVQIDVFKEADANIVALAERVRARLGDPDAEAEAREEAAAAPAAAENGNGERGGEPAPIGLARQLAEAEGATLQVVADRSLFIESSIREVRNTALLGGLLAVLVLFLFLKNGRATAIVAVAIPVSLAITFAPMHLLGVSLNIMSLGGLALGVGMLVDSSIVVLESIYRCREEGDSLVAAAVRGTAEVRGAVVASTLTSIAVFFPMVFVEGIAGQAFGDLGLAVVVSLLASLVVAVFLIPMLASREARRIVGAAGEGTPLRSRLGRWVSWPAFRRDLTAANRWLRPILLPYLAVRLVLGLALEALGKLVLVAVWAVTAVARRLLLPAGRRGIGAVARLPLALAERGLGAASRLYPGAARWAIRHAGFMAVLTVAILGLTGWLFASLDSELLPEVHQGEVTFELALPVGTPLEETDRVLGPLEARILSDPELRGRVESVVTTVGFDAAGSQDSDEGEHSAEVKLLLTGSDPAVEEAVVERLREWIGSIPDLDARVTRPVLFSSKTPIEVEVHGDDLRRLRELGERVRDEMAALPQLADVETSLEAGAPEVQIVYDRDRLARYDLQVRRVAELVRSQVRGTEATRFNLQDRRVPILVRLGEEDRESVADVSRLAVNPGGERPIPLSAVADVRLGEGPSEVRRIDGRRVALVSANVAPEAGSLSDAVAAIRARLDRSIDWPADTTYFVTGQNEEWERSRGSLWMALGLAVFLVYVIMAAQFESLLHPLVILFTIPLAFFGTAVGLVALGHSLSIVVFLGMIMLAGIVVNNAIVLVDYVNTLRRRGMARDEAIVTAGSVRLRPILMTTATTVLGLTPMALGVGDGAEIRTPMAIAVITGLIASTLLTLVVIPAVYAGLDRTVARLLGREERTGGGREDEAAAPAVPDAGAVAP